MIMISLTGRKHHGPACLVPALTAIVAATGCGSSSTVPGTAAHTATGGAAKPTTSTTVIGPRALPGKCQPGTRLYPWQPEVMGAFCVAVVTDPQRRNVVYIVVKNVTRSAVGPANVVFGGGITESGEPPVRAVGSDGSRPSTPADAAGQGMQFPRLEPGQTYTVTVTYPVGQRVCVDAYAVLPGGNSPFQQPTNCDYHGKQFLNGR